jgi:hypothetical protein
MATTTNYGWTTPNDSDPFKQGALAIRTLGSAIDTTLGSFFNIKQIVQASTATPAGSSVNTGADTGLTATITPTSASNKILVFVSQNGIKKVFNTSCNISLLRNGTSIRSIANQVGFTNTVLESAVGGVSTTILDAPATTSAVTYKTQFASQANIGFVDVQFSNSTSSIVLVEVEA